MPFFPNSALCSKNYPRNINHMPAVIFFSSLDFGKNCYSRTASYARALRRIGNYFDGQLDNLSQDQLLDYFHELSGSHSWSAVKLDLYGLKFFYTILLRQLNTCKLSFPRRRESRNTLDAGSSPA